MGDEGECADRTGRVQLLDGVQGEELSNVEACCIFEWGHRLPFARTLVLFHPVDPVAVHPVRQFASWSKGGYCDLQG